MNLTRPRGWLRPLLDCGSRVPKLLALLPEQAEFATAVAAAASPSSHSASAPDTTDTAAVAKERLVVPLSSRELDVLRLLGSDLDGPALARQLNVSLPTVRTHTQHIYAKLGVNNRRAAVRRGHQLHL